MIYLLAYLAIGIAAAWHSHATGKIDQVMQDSIDEGISDNTNLVLFAVAIGCLFAWPLLLASYWKGFFERLGGKH